MLVDEERGCLVPNATDKGCCALEFGDCQPQCRNWLHLLIQQHLMLSSYYHTHAMKTKKEKLQFTRLIMGWGWLQNRRDRKEKETKYDRLEPKSDPLFTGLEELQRYVTGTIFCKKELWSTSVDLLTPTDSILKERTTIRV